MEAKAQGFRGAKLKVGKPHLAEDVARLAAVREAVGDAFELMVDANQCFNVSEAIRRARAFEPFGLAWLEEPLPAEDMAGHVELAAHTAIPIAVGESIYHPSHFREYLAHRACSIVQVDCARIGGITPWLKVAHLAETFNVAVCPHFLMELHVSLTAAVPNAAWVEYIPQLDDITTSRLAIADGHALAPSAPGLGIDWDFPAIERRAVARATGCLVTKEATMLTRASLTIRLHPDDDVVIARTQLVGGTLLAEENVTISGLIPPGHKVATRAIRAGEPVKRYNQIIGFASRDIGAGRARPPQQPGDGRVRSRLRVRRRREADASTSIPRRRSWASSVPTAAWPRATTSASCPRSIARRPWCAASPMPSAATGSRRFPASTAWSR